MINKLPIYIFALFCFSAVAAKQLSDQDNCGVFRILGTVKENSQKKLVVIINEGTKSEITLSTPIQNELKFMAYQNRPLIGEFEISKKFNGTRGEITRLITIDYRAASPLNIENNTGIKLIKKIKCQ